VLVDRLLSEERINPALKNINQDHAMSFFHFLASVKRTLEERRGRRKSINLAIVSANNHYAGFGPGTANIFRKMVGLQEAQFSKDAENKKEEDDKSNLHSSSSLSIQEHSKQSTISDFMT
jgi:hypothetical protein